jgi:hypothetical protein
MNFGQAFSFPFQDPDWLKKIGIMGLITLIPIIGQIIALGWSLEITRRVIKGSPVILPDIDLGTHLSEGLKAFVVSLGYSLPMIILSIPLNVLPLVMENSSSADGSEGVMVALTLCCSGIILLYSLFVAFVVPAAFGNLVDKGTISAGFDFKTIFGLVRTAPVAYLLVVAGAIVGSIIASLGMIACFIGIIFTSVYYLAVMGNLYGQAFNEANRNQQIASQPYTTL